MNIKLTKGTLIAGIAAVWVLAANTVVAADAMTRLDARSKSKMRMEGTSTLHDWQVESPIIMGYLEVGPAFPLDPGQDVKPGKIEAKGEASVMVRSLRSVESDGKYYSDKMDEKMWEMMSLPKYPKIVYRLSELVLKETPKQKTDPYVFESKGDLAIAGKTNTISMTINVLPMGEKSGDKLVKISGKTQLKMTSYGIEPNSIIVSKTGDDITIKFDWMVGKKTASAAAK